LIGPSSGSSETNRSAAGVASSSGMRSSARTLVLGRDAQPDVGQRGAHGEAVCDSDNQLDFSAGDATGGLH
jgi:hypothetical protein